MPTVAQTAPDITAVADHLVKAAVSAYHAGTHYEGSVVLDGNGVTVLNRDIFDKAYNPWDDVPRVRLGSKLSVHVLGAFRGRYDSELVTLAIEEHGPDYPLASTEYVEFFERLQNKHLWNGEVARGGYVQELWSCQEPVDAEIYAMGVSA